MKIREAILEKAKQTICKDRQDQYGNAEDVFQLIADYWNVYLCSRGRFLQDGLDPMDVAMMMDLLKTARCAANPQHMDNYIDKIGYTALCAEMMEHNENEEELCAMGA